MSDHEDGHGNSALGVREQDRLLPIANISRIMKRAVPEAAKVAKGAKETIQDCVSEFIGFITSEASDLLQAEKRKTITGDDIVTAMNALGFEPYCAVLSEYLKEYRKEVRTKKAGGEDPDLAKKSTRGRKRKRPPSPQPLQGPAAGSLNSDILSNLRQAMPNGKLEAVSNNEEEFEDEFDGEDS
jgi:nuclear transcription Y subunit beta